MKDKKIPKYLKPSEYATLYNIGYRTVIKHFKKGMIKGYQNPETGTIYIENPDYIESKMESPLKNRVILYARVSGRDNINSLDGQLERLTDYAIAKGYYIVDRQKEIASGLNENRRLFNHILERDDYDILLVEHKERLTRFGYGYIEMLLRNKNIRIDVLDTHDTIEKTKEQELVEDLIAIVTSFCAKLYSARRKERSKGIIDNIKKNVNKLKEKDD